MSSYLTGRLPPGFVAIRVESLSRCSAVLLRSRRSCLWINVYRAAAAAVVVVARTVGAQRAKQPRSAGVAVHERVDVGRLELGDPGNQDRMEGPCPRATTRPCAGADPAEGGHAANRVALMETEPFSGPEDGSSALRRLRRRESYRASPPEGRRCEPHFTATPPAAPCGSRMVEAAGVEPASGNTPARGGYRLSSTWNFAPAVQVERNRRGLVRLISPLTPGPRATGQPTLVTPFPPAVDGQREGRDA